MSGSRKPRTQRKSRYNAPNHERRLLMSAQVSKELREKFKLKRSIPVRKGDTVKLVVGDKKGHTGKVLEVDYGTLKITIEGLMNKTAKGREKARAVDPSNVIITAGEFGSDRIGK